MAGSGEFRSAYGAELVVLRADRRGGAGLYSTLREATDDPGQLSRFLDDAGIFPLMVPLKEADRRMVTDRPCAAS